MFGDGVIMLCQPEWNYCEVMLLSHPDKVYVLDVIKSKNPIFMCYFHVRLHVEYEKLLVSTWNVPGKTFTVAWKYGLL